MPEACFLTVCSADSYQWFVPLYVYSIGRAYPEYHVDVLVSGGNLNQDVCQTMELVERTVHPHYSLAGVPGHVVSRPSTCNCLRYLVPEDSLTPYKYVLFTDVDMVIFRHEPTHVQYYKGVMSRTHQPYAGLRGALRRPRRNRVTGGQGWDGLYHRVVGGLFAVRTKPWLRATRDEYRRYRGIAATGKADGRDAIPWASYPEYDEVMLARIIRYSGLALPSKKFQFVDESRFDMRYRDIHLGDFEGDKWRSKRKLYQRLTKWALKQYRALERDPVWQDLVKRCCQDDRVRRLVHNLRVEAGIR